MIGPARRLARSLACAIAASLAACASTPDFVPLIRRCTPAVVGVGDNNGVAGSGFRVLGTRLIATAAHTLTTLQGRPVVRWKARRWPARVRMVDKALDLALLEVDATADMPGLPLARAQVAAGQWVLVLGRPFGAGPTATVGIVSALPGAVTEPEILATRLQLNAAVNPGNSGGPVVNLGGEVVGIANATVPGGYGLGFAVPVAGLAEMIASLQAER